jgi:hypothetical protein
MELVKEITCFRSGKQLEVVCIYKTNGVGVWLDCELEKEVRC